MPEPQPERLTTTRQVTQYDDETREKAFALYAQSKSLEDIAAALSVPYGTITQWSSRYKWKSRFLRAAQQAGRLPQALNEEETQAKDARQAREDRELTLGEAQEEYNGQAQAQALRMMRAIAALPSGALVGAAEKIAKLDATARKALKLETDKPTTVINIGMLASGAIKSARLASDAPAEQPLSLYEATGSQPAALADDTTQTIDVESVTDKG